MAIKPTGSQSENEQKPEENGQDEALIREIYDAVREEQYINFLRDYGKIIAGVLIGGLALFAAYLGWDHFHEKSLEGNGEKLVAALDQLEAGNLTTSSTQLDTLIGESDGGVKANAQLLKAGILMEQGKAGAAAKIFAMVAEDADAPQSVRDLARIREVAATFDSRKPDDVIKVLSPYVTDQSPFFGSAGELTAMALLAKGENDKAGKLLAKIAKDENVAQSLRSRSRQLAGLLGADAIDDVSATLKELANTNASGGQ